MTAPTPPAVALPLIANRAERLAAYMRGYDYDPAVVHAAEGIAADLAAVVEQLTAREVTL